MKKYTIIQTAPAVQTWTFEIVANSEEEAIKMVEDGDAECCDYEVDGGDYFGGDITVQDVEDIQE